MRPPPRALGTVYLPPGWLLAWLLLVSATGMATESAARGGPWFARLGALTWDIQCWRVHRLAADGREAEAGRIARRHAGLVTPPSSGSFERALGSGLMRSAFTAVRLAGARHLVHDARASGDAGFLMAEASRIFYKAENGNDEDGKRIGYGMAMAAAALRQPGAAEWLALHAEDRREIHQFLERHNAGMIDPVLGVRESATQKR